MAHTKKIDAHYALAIKPNYNIHNKTVVDNYVNDIVMEKLAI